MFRKQGLRGNRTLHFPLTIENIVKTLFMWLRNKLFDHPPTFEFDIVLIIIGISNYHDTLGII